MPAPQALESLSLTLLLRDATARLRTWYIRSPTAAAVTVTSSAIPTLHSIPLVDQVEARRDFVGRDQTKSQPKRRRPVQPRPTLWNVKSSATQGRLYCGPVAVAALIGANVDEVIQVIQRHRNNRRQVRGAHPHELQHAFRQFGHDIQLVADLSRNSPTLATWEREGPIGNLNRRGFWSLLAIGSQFAADGSSTPGATAPQSGSQMRLGGGNGSVMPTGFIRHAHNNTHHRDHSEPNRAEKSEVALPPLNNAEIGDRALW